MGNSGSGVRRRVKKLNALLRDAKFISLTNMRLRFVLDDKKSGAVLTSLTGSNKFASVIGTVNLEDLQKIEEIVKHVTSLDSTLSIDEDSACSICLDRFADTCLPCGHQYCFEDIRAWGSKAQECPICRESFDVNEDYFRRTKRPFQFKQDICMSKERMLSLISFT